MLAKTFDKLFMTNFVKLTPKKLFHLITHLKIQSTKVLLLLHQINIPTYFLLTGSLFAFI